MPLHENVGVLRITCGYQLLAVAWKAIIARSWATANIWSWPASVLSIHPTERDKRRRLAAAVSVSIFPAIMKR
jgi:hypothetical protein